MLHPLLELEEALRQVNLGLELDPFHARLLELRCDLLFALGRGEESREQSRRALRMDPANAARVTRSSILMAQGLFGPARQDLVEYLEHRETDDAYGMTDLAMLCQLEGDTVAAVDLLRRSLEVNARLTETLEAQGHREEGRGPSLDWSWLWLGLFDPGCKDLPGREAAQGWNKELLCFVRGESAAEELLDAVERSSGEAPEDERLTVADRRCDALVFLGLKGPVEEREALFRRALSEETRARSREAIIYAHSYLAANRVPPAPTRELSVAWTPELLDALERLASLRERGLLSVEELQQAKKKLFSEHAQRDP